MTSKGVKELVGKVRPSFRRSFKAADKLHFILRQLRVMTDQCRISKLELKRLQRCEMKGQDAARLAGVLAQRPAAGVP